MATSNLMKKLALLGAAQGSEPVVLAAAVVPGPVAVTPEPAGASVGPAPQPSNLVEHGNTDASSDELFANACNVPWEGDVGVDQHVSPPAVVAAVPAAAPKAAGQLSARERLSAQVRTAAKIQIDRKPSLPSPAPVAPVPPVTPVVLAVQKQSPAPAAPSATTHTEVPAATKTVAAPPPEADPPAAAPLRAAPAALSAADRLRQSAERAQKIPPLQLESRGSKETKALIEGGAPAPARYPGADEWPSDTLPPGSQYSGEEWQAARSDADGNRFAVIEIQTGDQAWLLQVILPTEVVTRKIVKGVMESQCERSYPPGVKEPGICSLVSQFYSDCIWVTTDAFPKFPGAAEGGKCIQNGVTYRVIRPRVDYTDPSRAFRVDAVMRMTNAGSLGLVEDETEDLGSTDVCSAPVG